MGILYTLEYRKFIQNLRKGEIINMNQDRNSHWPIYDKVPLELIKGVSDTVKKAREGVVKGNESKDGLVIYFPSREK